MKIGYARVSTNDQNSQLQLDALNNAGCDRIYEERMSAKTKDRPELNRLLDAIREGDTVVVWRLDRLVVQ
jgi:DNA invertase Pin-like site-specific DNA recombinase